MFYSRFVRRRSLGVLIALFAVLICLPALSTSAHGHCSAGMNNRAVSLLVDAQKSWPSLLKHQKTYVVCDDGELGEGYSDAVVYLFAKHWDQFGTFAAIARKDSGFERWAISHIDASASNSDLQKVVSNANNCTGHPKIEDVCKIIRRSAKNALVDSARTQHQAGHKINTYAYVDNNPLSYIDPLGLYWQFSDSSGQWTYVNNQTGAVTSVGQGYSGTGKGRNNPAMQNVPNVGPTPQGTYTIGPGHYSPHTGPNTMNLTPAPGTDTFGRDLFRIHGNNAKNDASHGCAIAPPNVRTQINNSVDRILQVVP